MPFTRVLRSFFEVVEKNFGGSLEGAATAVWTVGLVVAALQVLAPFFRVAVEFGLARGGLHPGWLADCAGCGSTSPLGDACLKCGAPLNVGVLAKLFTRRRAPRPAVQRLGWAVSLLGAIAFLVGAFWLVGLAPHSALERLFGGAALICWAGVGAFLARAFGPRGGGPIGRVRDLFFAVAAGGLLAVCVFLEQNVHPLPERVLGRVVAVAGAVELDGGRLQLAGPELGLEVQLIEGVGMSRVLPLAWVGATRSPIELTGVDAWLRDHSWKNAGALRELGVQVKRRTETFPLGPGDKFELVLRDRDVILRPVK